MQETWNSTQPLPDLRLIIIEPASLNQTSLARLEEAGWGLCHMEMPVNTRLSLANTLNTVL